MKVASPCISICSIEEASGFCKGCKRTLQEVAMWLYMSEEEKARVVAQLPERKLAGSGEIG